MADPGARPREMRAAARPALRQKSTVREYAEALAVALLLALFIRAFVVQAFKIPSGSMLPTLQVGDHILVNKFLYGVSLPLMGTRLFAWHRPQHGDVIVFVSPADHSKDFIKRAGGTAEWRGRLRGRHGNGAADFPRRADIPIDWHDQRCHAAVRARRRRLARWPARWRAGRRHRRTESGRQRAVRKRRRPVLRRP